VTEHLSYGVIYLQNMEYAIAISACLKTTVYFASTSGIRNMNIDKNMVTSHEWGKDRELFTTSGTYTWSFVYSITVNQVMVAYSRAYGSYQDFLDRGLLLTMKLLNQGFLLAKLKSSFRKIYGRHYDLIDCYVEDTKGVIRIRISKNRTQWPNEKLQKDKQWSTKHTYKTKDRVTRTLLKTGLSQMLRKGTGRWFSPGTTNRVLLTYNVFLPVTPFL
jgi:hypothetical protein